MKRKIIKILLFITIAVYAVITFINEQTDYNKELAATKDNVNSEEFIEEMAREKLDMYLPTERVYVDTGM